MIKTDKEKTRKKQYHSIDDVLRDYFPNEYIASKYSSMDFKDNIFGKQLIEKFINQIDSRIMKNNKK